MWRPDPTLGPLALAILALAAGLSVQPAGAQDAASPRGEAPEWAVPALSAVLQEDVRRAPEAAPVPNVLSSLDTIETSTLVLEALARNAEARADLCRLGGPAAAVVCGDVGARPAPAAAGPPPPSGPVGTPPADAPPPLPRVVEIVGARGMLTARLAMPDGGGMIVRSGTRLGALTITTIAPHRVEVRRDDGERLNLPLER